MDLTTRKLFEVSEAAEVLRGGGVVAFPTETVFGLGACFDQEDAVRRIFEAKQRPADNPLIVHLASRDQLPMVCAEVTPIAARLLEVFAPGPLTVVLPKTATVPEIVSAGLPTVAVRIPSHRQARALISHTGVPVVAPSANRSGRPSPTTWQAVWEDLSGRIDAVLIGQPTDCGLESTVVDCTATVPKLLRSGAVTIEQLRHVVGEVDTTPLSSDDAVKSPGLRHRHYSPRAKVVLFDFSDEVHAAAEIGYLGLEMPKHADRFGLIETFADAETYARQLYEALRQADRQGLTHVYCQRVHPEGIGYALMDRLNRAST